MRLIHLPGCILGKKILSGCLSFSFSSTIDMWDPHVWQIRGCFGPAWNDTSAVYAGLCTLNRRWTFGASWGTAVWQVLRLRTVLDITSKFQDCWCISLQGEWREFSGENICPLPAYFPSSNQAFTGKVLVPIPIKPRGAQCKNRHKAFHERS
jgi:hypothetical protein